MAIDSFTALKSFITADLQLDAETASRLDDFIVLAEAELGRLLDTPEREVTAYADTVAAQQTLALPDDFREARTIQLDDDYPLSPVTLNVLLGTFSGDSQSGKPQVYTIANRSLWFGPIPDTVYRMTMTYLAGLEGLSATNATNWLLTTHPDAYRWAVSLQIEAWFENETRLPILQAKLSDVVEQINIEGNRYRNAAPMRLRSPVVV